MSQIKQKLIFLGFSVLFCVGCLFFILYLYIKQIENETFAIQQAVDIEITAGDTFYSLMNRFSDKQWLDESWRLTWLVRLNRKYASIKQGYYRIEPDQTLGQVLRDFTEGKEYLFRVTLIEGITIKEALSVLNNAEHLEHDLSRKQPLLDQLQIDERHPEGMFFPDTYDYRYGDNDKVILQRAYERLIKELAQAWENRNQSLPYKTAYEMLIMASIIEKETSVESERKMVSAVFVNRLRKKMRLQTDPTVIYGMGERYKGNIRRKDLQEKTPYNTYRISGLPPTPIALVGRASLEAAAHPDDVDYLYFVSKNDGSHYFSKTLAEHEAAVDKYQRKRKRSSK
jgi:UPF0755 protein